VRFRHAGTGYNLNVGFPHEQTHGNEEGCTMSMDIWTFQEVIEPVDITGFSVEATDGSIGKVDEATYEAGSSHTVIDTGPWIFGKKVMVPAGAIQEIDLENKVVKLNRTKDEVKNSPGWDPERFADPAYRGDLGAYYDR